MLLIARRYRRPLTVASGDPITLSVVNGMARVTISAVEYEWPVWVGGAGAAADTFDVSNGIATFTVAATNYEFAVSVGGLGSTTMSVTNGMARITESGTNYQFPVSPV